MASNLNALRWAGQPGHYEVYYVSLTDRGSGWGIWIRYTMVAPAHGGQATASLWLMAMRPDGNGAPIGRKATFTADALHASAEPFDLRIGDAVLSERGAQGRFEDVAWSLRWEPDGRPAEHVHPVLQRARLAKTVLVLPQPDLAIAGTVRVGERELGPNTPVVGRLGGDEFRSTSPARVSRNQSSFALTSWNFEARDGSRKIAVNVDAPRESLVGMTYTDPDGELAYCYNTEVASLRCRAYERDRSEPSGWRLSETLVAPSRAHFEYAQREPVPGLELHVR